MRTAFLFPGQSAGGWHGGGHCRGFPVLRKGFDQANEILGYNLKRLCFEGPEEQLNSTTVSQPAIFVTSTAILSVLRSDPAAAAITPDVTAGLSLGNTPPCTRRVQ